MEKKYQKISRRTFLKATGATAASGMIIPPAAHSRQAVESVLEVWSCGGLAEAFMPANKEFERNTHIHIAYTGAFAAALGKSLLGNAQTEVFAPRVVGLAQKLKAQGKMLWYKPLCFTKYVIAVPLGNPKKITSIQDLVERDVRIVLSPDASPPGGKATIGILKKAGVYEAAKNNVVFNGDCAQRSAMLLTEGKADAGIVEQRITRLPAFKGKLDTIAIEEKFIPPPPVPFTIGMMKWAKNPSAAQQFIDYILSGDGQKYFEQAGFIPAISDEGKIMAEKYGV